MELNLFCFVSELLEFISKDGYDCKSSEFEVVEVLSVLLVQELNWSGKEGYCYLNSQ